MVQFFKLVFIIWWFLEYKKNKVPFFFQSRAQVIVKQLQELYEQLEQADMELSTFKFLQQQEIAAIPRRLEVIRVLFLFFKFCLFS